MASPSAPALPKISMAGFVAIGAWVAALLVAAAVWFTLISPDLATMNQKHGKIGEYKAELAKINLELSKRGDVLAQMEQDVREMSNVTNTHALTMLYNSYEQQAKELIMPIAERSGFTLVQANPVARYRIPMLAPSGASKPSVYFDRIGIEFIGDGGYFAMVDFIAGVEERFPYVSITELKISHPQTRATDQKSVEKHRAVMVLEWPTVGEEPPPPAEKKGGRAGVR